MVFICYNLYASNFDLRSSRDGKVTPSMKDDSHSPAKHEGEICDDCIERNRKIMRQEA